MTEESEYRKMGGISTGEQWAVRVACAHQAAECS